MTLFDLPEGDPDPRRHRRPPDPDRLTRTDIEDLIPNLDVDGLTTHERAVIRQVVAEHLRSPFDLCSWRGCMRPAVHGHHTLPKEVGGRLSECATIDRYCELHHECDHILRRHFRTSGTMDGDG